jgi:hypothetical protein
MVVEASSTNNHFRGTTPFKVQVNFYIPLFEGLIDVDDIDKWLNILECYYSIQKIYDGEKITLRSLNPFPMSNLGGKVIGRGTTQMNLHHLRENPHGQPLWIPSRRSYTLLEAMMTSI